MTEPVSDAHPTFSLLFWGEKISVDKSNESVMGEVWQVMQKKLNTIRIRENVLGFSLEPVSKFPISMKTDHEKNATRFFSS
ncbi:MAG: hypothetical protein AAF203_11010 [Pseudomonadota bacterium]